MENEQGPEIISLSEEEQESFNDTSSSAPLREILSSRGLQTDQGPVGISNNGEIEYYNTNENDFGTKFAKIPGESDEDFTKRINSRK